MSREQEVLEGDGRNVQELRILDVDVFEDQAVEREQLLLVLRRVQKQLVKPEVAPCLQLELAIGLAVGGLARPMQLRLVEVQIRARQTQCQALTGEGALGGEAQVPGRR